LDNQGVPFDFSKTCCLKDRILSPLLVVVIKFTAPRMEDTPAKCREKIVRSTDAPAFAIPLARRG
jgi:hypothetical protein